MFHSCFILIYLSNSHGNHGSVVQVGHDRGEQTADHIDGHGEEHDPLGGEQLSDTGSGNLREEVAPEVAAEDRSLKRFAPVEGSILRRE